jgi:hypothetical protein
MDLFEWGNITTGMYVALIIAGICMLSVIFRLEKIIGKKTAKEFLDYSEECLVGCSDKDRCDKLAKWRDNNYYMYSGDNSKRCIVTKWEISHFITHAFLGYFFNIYISQGISFGFEIYERYSNECGSYLDLGYNFAGFLFGHLLKNYINCK